MAKKNKYLQVNRVKKNSVAMKNNSITVKNVEEEANTQAEIVVQNKINFIPKVSVIIPVYNVEKYIGECLDSVINQTLKEIEIICVDDGSSDNSLEVLKTYAKKDKRIKIISRENKGVGYSRNQGIEIAQGTYIAFMDPDDYYPSVNVLQDLYNGAIKHKVNICGGSLILFDEVKGVEIKKTDCNNKFSKDAIMAYSDFQYDYGFQRYIFNTKFLKNNKIIFPNYKRFQDVPFLVNAMATAKEFYAMSLYSYGYRWSHKTVAWTEEKVYHLLLGLKDVLEICLKNQLDKLYSVTLVRLKNEYKKIIAEFETDRIKSVKQEIMDLCLSNVKNRYKNDKTKAKVSIVLPIYNAEPYLKECLDSCINQTLKDIEIICVNDGSTDNSLSIVKEYAKKDKRIKYIDKPNAGYGQTMNCGMALASGEYIGIVEPDDFIKLDMYETLYKKAKSENFDIVKSDYCTFDKKSSQYVNIVSKDSYNINISRHTNRQYIGFTINPTGIFKRDFINKYHLCFNETPGAAHQDIGFAMLTAFFAESATFINQDFYQYRQDNDNSSMHRFAKPNIMIDEYNFIYNKLIEYPIVFNEVKDLFYQRRHNSLMYFGKNRISDVDKVYFWQRVQAIYQADKTKNFLDVLSEKQKKEANDVMNQKLENETSNIKIENTVSSSKTVIPVVLSSDNNYALPTAVCLYSILEKTSAYLDFYILADNLTKENIYKIKKSIKKFKNYRLQFVDMKKYNLKQFPKIDRFESSVYSRYFIPEICKQYDKVIYSDVDVVFNGDIQEYYNIDLEGYGLAASPEELGKLRYGEFNHELRKNRFNIPQDHLYFSNGNLIISCDYWRKNNITEKLVNKTIELKDSLVCPDLDVMNFIFQKNYKRLHFRYCATTHRYTEIDGNQEMIDGYKNPFIIHYSGGRKPWKRKDIIFFDEFNLIYKKTAFSSDCHSNYNIKAYLLFPLYLYKLSKAKKKLLRLTCKNIWQQLIKNNVNVFSLNKDSLSGLILKYNPQSEYVKKNLKYITNTVYDKCKYRKKHRFLGVKFYTHNKHKELMHLMQYTLTRVNQVESQIQSLKVPVLNNSNQINVIQKTNTTIGIQLDKSLKELSVLNNEIFKIKDDCQCLKQNDVNTQEILVNSKKDIDGIYQMILDVQTNLSDVQQKVFGTKEDVSHVRKTLVTTKGDVANVHKTVLRIKEGISDVQKTVCDTKEDIANVQQTAVSTRDNIANVQQTVVSTKEDIANVQQTVVSTKEDVATVQQTVVSTKEDIANVQQTAVNMSKTVDAMKDSALNTQKIVGHLNYQSQRNFHELNYADLLHDTICESSWLKNKTLSLFGWAANYSFIYLLYRVLDKVMPQNILEMGLGQTTKLTAQYVAHKNPSARLNVCEHNQDWINIYQSELPQSDNMTINHFDLTFFEYEGKQNDKYKDITQKFESEKFDLIIVDGPVGGGKNLPRSNILELIQNDNLANDFVIVFDDSERNGEQNTIKQTRALLQEKGVDFSEFDRNGIKNQHIITSQSRSFVQFL